MQKQGSEETEDKTVLKAETLTKGTKQKEPDKLTATEGNTETCAVLSHHRVGNYKLRLKDLKLL